MFTNVREDVEQLSGDGEHQNLTGELQVNSLIEIARKIQLLMQDRHVLFTPLPRVATDLANVLRRKRRYLIHPRF